MIGTVGARAQLAADGEAVDVGQAEVEQDDIRLRRLERLRARSRRASTSKPFAPQPLDERLGDRVLVLDDQDPRTATSSHAPGCAHRGFTERERTLVRGLARPCRRGPTVDRMRRIHALASASRSRLAAVAGGFAAIRTTALASSTTPHVAQPRSIARTGCSTAPRRRCARRRGRRRRRCRRSRRTPAAAEPPAVVYRRAAAIVRVVPRHGGEDGEHGAANDRGELPR